MKPTPLLALPVISPHRHLFRNRFFSSSFNAKTSTVTMRPFFCLLAILAILLPLAAAARSGMTGGWKPIKDINDTHVKEIAVSEYNKKSGKKLEFQSVVKGETQVVAGENYRLVIAVKDNSAAAKYEGVVYEKIWEHTRRSFGES